MEAKINSTDARIEVQIAQINQNIERYLRSSHSFAFTNKLIQDCKPLLTEIRDIVGEDKASYTQCATQLARIILDQIKQDAQVSDSISLLQERKNTLKLLSQLEVSYDFKHHELGAYMANLNGTYERESNEFGREHGWIKYVTWPTLIALLAIGSRLMKCANNSPYNNNRTTTTAEMSELKSTPTKTPKELAMDRLEAEVQREKESQELANEKGDYYQGGDIVYDRVQNRLICIIILNNAATKTLANKARRRSFCRSLDESLTIDDIFANPTSVADPTSTELKGLMIRAQADLEYQYITASNKIIFEKTFSWKMFKCSNKQKCTSN